MMEVAGELPGRPSVGCSSPGLSSDLSRSCCLSAKVLPGVRAQADHLHGACQGPQPSTQTPTPVLRPLVWLSRGAMRKELGRPALIHSLRC